MRDLINMLNESVGLANRKRGETFANPAGDLLTFNSLSFFPNVGKFDNAEDMKSLIAEIQQRKGLEIQWVNKPLATSLGFGVVEMTDTNRQLVLYGRYFTTINSIFTANYWPNSGLPNGLRLNKAAATKMSSGLMVQDILTSMEDLTPSDIESQVSEHFGKSHPLTTLTSAIVAGASFPITVDVSEHTDISFSAFRDYFAEILQPIVVKNGRCSGNANVAEEMFLGKNGFDKCTITFSTGKNQGLYDSLLVAPSGQVIKISTKAGSGSVSATASVKNLSDAVDELTKSGNTQLASECADTITLVKEAARAGQSKAPLVLAVKFGIISGKESTIVESMRTKADVTLTANLQEIYTEKEQRSVAAKVVPYYTMLAAIAELVSAHVNDNTSFGEDAASILNNSALVQVYTDAKEGDGNFIISGFRANYPSKAVSTVLFYSGKTYYSSGIKGNFTFKIGKNKDTAIDDEVSTQQADAELDTDIDNIVNHRSSIRPPGARAERTDDGERRGRR